MRGGWRLRFAAYHLLEDGGRNAGSGCRSGVALAAPCGQRGGWESSEAPQRCIGAGHTLRFDPDKELGGKPIKEVSNEIAYDNWAVTWGRDFEERETTVQVGNDYGYVGVGVGLEDREASTDVGFGKAQLSVSTDESGIQGGVGVFYGPYGERVDRDFDDAQTAVEVAVRHGFDDVQDRSTNDDEELATEVFVGWKSTSLAVGADVNDTEYAVSVGTLGRHFSVLREFDERETDFQSNWCSTAISPTMTPTEARGYSAK
mmetsp:Transcript_5577/g.15573  ORF Transcript_5577/g.15573 Transcript_5577/m.15573 type:complete len:259 (+) Transcript_5577:925-1701(+)